MSNKLLHHAWEYSRSFPRVRFAVRACYQLGMHSLRGGRHVLVGSEADMAPGEVVSDDYRHCFFGYYDKCPWDRSGEYLLCHRVAFVNRMPKPGESAEICLVACREKKTTTIGETTAWCWQQGSMLRWLENDAGRRIIHNDFREGKYVSVIIGLDGSEQDVLPAPVYAVSKDGKQAVSVDFGRLHHGSRGYGYVAKPYAGLCQLCPDDTGIYHMDLATGECRLVLSLAQIAVHSGRSGSGEAFNYFNHLEFNPSGTRFVFLHRWFKRRKGGSRGQEFTRMFTAKPDGSDIYLLADYGMVSHFTWRDDRHLLAWANHDAAGRRYYLFEDQTENVEIVGEDVLTEDGHPSYSPNGRWILTDTYPNREGLRTLILYDTREARRYDVGRYYSPVRFRGPLRCDLHPRWSPDGGRVCFDSIHRGRRGVFVMDVAERCEN